MADNQDELISQFVEVTGSSAADAQQYLAANQWDIGGATTEYFTALEEGDEDDAQQPGPAAPTEPYTGPRTLDGRPAPESAPAASSSSKPAAPKRGGIATLGSLGSSSHAGHGHAHDDDDSDDDDEAEQPRDLFAGGEKSGLAVQDPSRNDPRTVVNEILKKARANAKRPTDEPEASSSRFRGTGQALGDESTPAQAPQQPAARAAPPTPTVSRVLHLWADGFSIDDGELRRFDDPRHARDLQMIKQGRAPLHLMGVQPDQNVDVQLMQHKENYSPPPKVYKPFSGGGNRLGSPTPGASSSTEPAPVASTPPAPAGSVPEPTIDSSQPTVSLRIQLADGTRLPARFNTTSTIGDVYDFINRASSASQRAWVLATTFPNKDHTDKTLQLGDVAEFKRGGTAVQKWA